MAKKRTRVDERRALKQYINRYCKAKKRLEALRATETQLRRDARHQGTVDTTGIEARIQRQAEWANQILRETTDMVDQLPEDSVERTILECRHLDCMPWSAIQHTVHLTRTPCYNHYIRALDQLLEISYVRTTLQRHYRDFSAGKNMDAADAGG